VIKLELLRTSKVNLSVSERHRWAVVGEDKKNWRTIHPSWRKSLASAERETKERILRYLWPRYSIETPFFSDQSKLKGKHCRVFFLGLLKELFAENRITAAVSQLPFSCPRNVTPLYSLFSSFFTESSFQLGSESLRRARLRLPGRAARAAHSYMPSELDTRICRLRRCLLLACPIHAAAEFHFGSDEEKYRKGGFFRGLSGPESRYSQNPLSRSRWSFPALPDFATLPTLNAVKFLTWWLTLPLDCSALERPKTYPTY